MKWKKPDKSRVLYKFAILTFPLRSIIAMICRIIIKMRKIRLFFVFGMSRSGTTFLGKVLTLDKKNSFYFHEPIKHLLNIHFQKEKASASFWDYVFEEERKSIKVHFLVCTVLIYVISRKLQSGNLLCIKPISMVDCVEETWQTIGGSILFISRHPCGRTESIIRQRRIYGNKATDMQDLTRLGSEWGRVHRKVQEQFSRYYDWSWVYFEQLCENPKKEIRLLYEEYDLCWSDSIEEKIDKMTKSKSRGYYSTFRNSNDQIDKWRNALTKAQIDAIRTGSNRYKTELYEGF